MLIITRPREDVMLQGKSIKERYFPSYDISRIEYQVFSMKLMEISLQLKIML